MPTLPYYLEELSQRPDQQLPPLWLSLAPIVLPVILITTNTLCKAVAEGTAAASIAATLGNANFALLVSTAIALWTLARQRGLSLREVEKAVEPALMSGGLIILITSAGGAFGKTLDAAGVGQSIEALSEKIDLMGPWLLVLGFGVAAVMKIAQGSGTVSMITTAGIMAPILAAMGNPEFHPVYMVMAIGCGSMVGTWMNDSGFWIVCRMSGFTEGETLRTWTVLLAFMGCIGLGLTCLMAWLVPLV